MTAALARDDDRIVLGLDGIGSSPILHRLSPILIGLVAPAIGCLLIFPGLVAHLHAVLGLALALVAAVAVAAYAATVLFPGDPTAFEIDAASRQVTVVLSGPFATRRVALSAEDISDIRRATFCDADGYEEEGTEVTTVDGIIYLLPGPASPVAISAARRAVGLRGRP